jgi:hypothetical protein
VTPMEHWFRIEEEMAACKVATRSEWADLLRAKVEAAIAAAVAEEREAAAWECDQAAKNWADDVQRPAAEECAARIRARSTEGGGE